MGIIGQAINYVFLGIPRKSKHRNLWSCNFQEFQTYGTLSNLHSLGFVGISENFYEFRENCAINNLFEINLHVVVKQFVQVKFHLKWACTSIDRNKESG